MKTMLTKEIVRYMNAFGLSKQYYSFDYVNAHVLTMASEITFSKGSAQYNFVENDLKTAARKSQY